MTSDGDGLSVRAGIHTGDVLRDKNDYVGLTVNKAARVAAAASGNQILISSTTADVVSHPNITLGDSFTVELKGLEGSHSLVAVDWA